MNDRGLQEHVATRAGELDVPGVAVGVHNAGEQHLACHGVTSITHPLPVDEHTLFQFGSTGKTYTATALMCLVESGALRLDERVRAYVPELRLQDEQVAEEVTVMHLLNHTSGFEGDVQEDTGEGEDSLKRYVATLADLPQNAPLGTAPSYNNAAFTLAGHVIERVTGEPYETALTRLLLEPLELRETFLLLNDMLSRAVSCGHTQRPDGTITVSRPWGPPRNDLPAGGRMVASTLDQLAWARFHLGDGRGPRGNRVLDTGLLESMQQVTAGEAPGERFGIAWILRSVDDVEIVEHGGDCVGQHSAFAMVPSADFAISVLTNAGPGGQELREELVRWALETYLGVVERDPVPLDLDEAQLAPYAGRYDTGAVRTYVTVAGNRLRFSFELQPATIERFVAGGEDHPEPPPPQLYGSIGGEHFVMVDGAHKGTTVYFVREPDGTVSAVNMGRLAPRVNEPADAR
jgi:CubicO group peptidase (beta-lactamase class C family)